MFSKIKKIKVIWNSLSTSSKLVYGCFFGNTVLLAAITTRRHLSNKKAEAFYTNRIIQSKNENDDWHCFHVAKQYRYECAFLNEDEKEELSLCKSLDNELENCRNKLYEYIKEDPPAMQKSIPIINKPYWIKDPEWVIELQKK